MGTPHLHPPTLYIAAIFSRYEPALDWAIDKIEQTFRTKSIVSERFEFTETAYYTRLMGDNLLKQLIAIDADYDPAGLADAKLHSNAWEVEYAQGRDLPEERPLNIDPGYVTPMKVVLASTKDRAHRIYLRDGIFAEECLYYHQHSWQGRPWTYPDYLRADYHRFLLLARQTLMHRLASRNH